MIMRSCLLSVETFSDNFNFHDFGSSLPAFTSKTNLKLLDIPVTPEMIKKVLTALDSSKTSGPYCIPTLVVL